MKNTLVKCFILLVAFNAYSQETRTKIAVIDSGLRVNDRIRPYLCKSGHNSFKSGWNIDVSGHGTNVANLIADSINSKTHCLMIMKVFYYNNIKGNLVSDTIPDHYIPNSIIFAIANGAEFINMSISSGPDYFKNEDLAIRKAIEHKIHVVLSAGNNGMFLSKECRLYPVCNKYDKKYFHIIGSKTNGSIANYSNYGPIVDDWVNGTDRGKPVMSGTSQSAAIFTGRLVNVLK